MFPWRSIAIFASLFASGNVVAQASFSASYDCWVGNSGGLYTTHYVRCIADRDSLSGSVMAGDEVLDKIHGLLHRSAIGEVERIVQNDPDLIRNGSVRSVALYSYPAEWSWDENLPQKLVSSAWCPSEDLCNVNMFRR